MNTHAPKSTPWRLILAGLVIVTFSPALFNGFVGDDHVVVGSNRFYHSWNNLPRLFSSSYFTDSDRAMYQHEEDFGSGSVGYRPVLSLTYFLDYALWKGHPFGYHLTNLLLHVAAVLLLYECLKRMPSTMPVAGWGALLFGVHPIAVEAVNAIGYRADLLSGVLILTAFLMYLKAAAVANSRRWWLRLGCWMVFLGAIFAKEVAAVLPLVLIVHMVLTDSWRNRQRWLDLGGIVVGLVFFLIVYFGVFPNATLDHVPALGATAMEHLTIVIRILTEYLFAFAWPLHVDILPPLYKPAAQPGVIGLSSYIVVAVYVALLLQATRQRHPAAFWLWWAPIFLLPVMHIIPIVNPMGYRFMYIAAGGLSVALMVLLHGLPLSLRMKQSLLTIFVALCMVWSFALSRIWKNDYTMAQRMVTMHPTSATPFFHYGQELFARGEISKARDALQQALDNGMHDPRLFYLLGVTAGDPGSATSYYDMSLQHYPQFAPPYVALARLHFLQSNYEAARPYLESAVLLNPSYTAYGYLIQIEILSGNPAAAERWRDMALEHVRDENQRQSLHNFFLPQYQNQLPVDIGI